MKQKLLMILALEIFCAMGFAQEKEYQVENDGFEWYKVKKVVNGETKYGAEDRYGNMIVPTEYSRMWYCSDDNPIKTGFGPRKGKYKAWYSKSGKCIVPYSRGYTWIQKWDEDEFGTYYNFEKPDGGGILDRNGREVASVKADGLSYINIGSTTSNGKTYYFLRFDIKKGGEEYTGIADATGKIIVRPEYKDHSTARDLAKSRLTTTTNPLAGNRHETLAEAQGGGTSGSHSLSSSASSSSSNSSSYASSNSRPSSTPSTLASRANVKEKANNPTSTKDNTPNSLTYKIWRKQSKTNNPYNPYIPVSESNYEFVRNTDGMVTKTTTYNCICTNGVCRVCYGIPTIYGPCISCKGSGRCAFCSGSGVRSIVNTFRYIDDYYINETKGYALHAITDDDGNGTVKIWGSGLEDYCDGVLQIFDSGKWNDESGEYYTIKQYGETFILSKNYQNLKLKEVTYHLSNKETFEQYGIRAAKRFGKSFSPEKKYDKYSRGTPIITGANNNSNIHYDEMQSLPNKHGNTMCKGCNGSGNCNVCGGTGKTTSSEYDEVLKRSVTVAKDCYICNGTGHCKVCYGTGRIRY